MEQKKDCREWLRLYAEDHYSVAGDQKCVDTFVEVCAQAIDRGSGFDALGQFAQATGRREHEIWFELRAMMSGMRVGEEVLNAVQIWQDLQDEDEDNWGWFDDED